MKASIKRETKETQIEVSLDFEGPGACDCRTGVPLLDEILRAVAEESQMAVRVRAAGDIETGDHHTVEDVGIALGLAVRKIAAAGAGSCVMPSGSCLALAAVRFGEPGYRGDFSFDSLEVGGMALENLCHFMRALAYNGSFTLHLRADGGDDRRKVDALSRALGRALSSAIADGLKRRS